MNFFVESKVGLIWSFFMWHLKFRFNRVFWGIIPVNRLSVMCTSVSKLVNVNVWGSSKLDVPTRIFRQWTIKCNALQSLTRIWRIMVLSRCRMDFSMSRGESFPERRLLFQLINLERVSWSDCSTVESVFHLSFG